MAEATLRVRVNTSECLKAGLDPKKVKVITNGLAKYARLAKEIGLTVFAQIGGNADLRIDDKDSPEHGPLICAEIDDGNWDGGDWGSSPSDHDGLIRGEM